MTRCPATHPIYHVRCQYFDPHGPARDVKDPIAAPGITHTAVRVAYDSAGNRSLTRVFWTARAT